jgi:hypothetical protein
MREFEIDRELADCAAAARVFGHTLEIPENEADELSQFVYSNWRRMRQARDPFVHGHGETGGPLGAILIGASAPDTTKKRAPLADMPPVKDIVLNLVKEAGERGTKAANIRSYISSTYGRKLHAKTVGMTLYRLAKEGLVHRQGHIWFFGPEKSETKNPGVAAPGPNNVEN